MKTVPRTAIAMLAAFAFAAAFLHAGPTRAANITEQIPADAWVVVKVNDLKAVSGKFGKWAEQLGLVEVQPQLADPLSAFKEEMKITKGLDESGEMAFVFLNPEQTGVPEDKSMLVLVPTQDYQAFIGNFGDAQTEGQITSVQNPDSGEDIFVTKWGDYAAISPARELIQKQPQGGLKVQGAAAKEFQEKDVVVYVNIPAMKETLLPQLKQARQQALEEINRDAGGAGLPPAADAGQDGEAEQAAAQEQGAAQALTEAANDDRGPVDQDQVDVADAVEDQAGPAETADEAAPAAGRPGAAPNDAGQPNPEEMARRFAPVARAAVNQIFGLAEQFLNETNAVTFSLDLNDQGLNTSLLADFAQGSELGNLAANLKGTDIDLLQGLPERNYYAFGGAALNSEALEKFLSKRLDPITRELAQAGPQAKTIADTIQAVQKSLAATESLSFGYPAATGAVGQESIIQQVQIFRGDAKQIAQTQQQALKGMNQLFAALPQPEGGEVNFDVTPNAKTVGGVKLDTYRMDIQFPEDDPQAAQAQQMMAMIYGPQGISGTMGAVDADTYIFVAGGTDKLLEDVVAAARADKDPFADNAQVQAVAKQLPDNRIAVEYVDLAQIVRSGVRYAQGFGVPVQMRLPKDLPPIGIAVAAEGTALRIDSHVPTNLLQSVIAAGMETYMNMMGAPDAGEPEGL